MRSHNTTSLTRVATAAAFLAMGVGAATAAESTLTVYGTLDASLTNTKTDNSAKVSSATKSVVAAGASSTITGVTNGAMTGSFIGLRGSEDLGGGMEASFALESYLNVDTGATSSNDATNSPLNGSSTYNVRDQGGFWARKAYVGLKTNYGLVRLGQMDAFGYSANEQFSPFGNSAYTPSRIFTTTDYYTQGWSNAVAYLAKVGSVGGGLMYSAKENANVASPGKGSKWSGTVGIYETQYAATVGYESNKSSVGTFLPAVNNSWLFNAYYDFGVVKLYGQYAFGKLDRGNGALPDVKSSGYQIGASAPLGDRVRLLVSYAAGTQKTDWSTSPVATWNKLKIQDAKVFTVGTTYDLSKRTNVYALYSNDQRDFKAPASSAPLSSVIPGQYAVFDNQVKTLALGVRHSF